MGKPDFLKPAPGTELDHNTIGKQQLRWILEGVAIATLPLGTLVFKNLKYLEPVTGLEGLGRNLLTISLISIAGDLLGKRGVVPLSIATLATVCAYMTAAEFDLTELHGDSLPTSVENGLNEMLILLTYAITGFNSYIAKNRGDGIAMFTLAKITKSVGNILSRGLNSNFNKSDNDN